MSQNFGKVKSVENPFGKYTAEKRVKRKTQLKHCQNFRT